MIFTQTGHFSKRTPVRHSEVVILLCPVSRVTQTVAASLQRAFVLGPRRNNVPASSLPPVICHAQKLLHEGDREPLSGQKPVLAFRGR